MLSSATESTSSPASFPAATTQQAKRPSNTSTDGTWAPSSTAPSNNCAKKDLPSRHPRLRRKRHTKKPSPAELLCHSQHRRLVIRRTNHLHPHRGPRRAIFAHWGV